MASKQLCCVLLGTALTLGCQNPDSGDGSMAGGTEGSSNQLPKIQVNLPPSPSFQKDHAPESYSDGSTSIYGLRKKLRRNLNKAAKVKAYIVEVYQCPDCPRGKKKKECLCDKPHLWLADRATASKDKGLMVTGIPRKHPKTRRKMKWQAGIAYHFDGVFSRHSGTGFSAADGLLIYQDATPAVAGD